MSIPLYVLVQGVVFGLLYGLLALGLVLVYKSNRVLNFAHGQLGAVSAIALERLVNDFDAPYWPTIVLCLVAGALIGSGVELLLRRLFTRPRFLVMVATIGVSQLLFVLGLVSFLQPEEGALPYPVPFTAKANVDTFVLQPGHLTILVVAPLVALALALFFRLTPYGLAIRAAAENGDSARLSGIWVRRMSTLSWAIAGLLSAIAAMLNGPFAPNVYAEAVGPGLLVKGLIAALIAGMVNLPAAFVAGIGVGVVEYVVYENASAQTVQLLLFCLLIVALVVRSRTLRITSRTEERSSWAQDAVSRIRAVTEERELVGRAATFVAVAVALLLPLLLPVSKEYVFTRIWVFAVVGLSLTLLAGWAGQLSLGHFGLLAVGVIVAARSLDSLPLPVVLVVAGVVTALVAVVIGLPALRIRGLYLAVITLGFAVVVQGWLVANPTLGLPDPAFTLVERPSYLRSEAGVYLFCLGLLAVVVIGLHHLRHSGVGRAMIAVRDNEVAAAAMGIRVTRVKLTAFAASGFLAGVAGVAFVLNEQQLSASASFVGGGADFDAYKSILIVSMAVIGGLGSIRGAVLGAVYLIGLPAALGTSQLIEVLTGGIGLTVFLLYLPGGLADALDRIGDSIASVIPRRGEQPAPGELQTAAP